MQSEDAELECEEDDRRARITENQPFLRRVSSTLRMVLGRFVRILRLEDFALEVSIQLMCPARRRFAPCHTIAASVATLHVHVHHPSFLHQEAQTDFSRV